MEFHFCDPCNKSFNGARPYREHMASENHKKNISKDQASSSAPRSTSGLSLTLADPFIEMRGKDFWCTLCKTELNSKEQATNHVFGSKHRKLKPSSQENMFSEVPKINLSDVQGSSPIFSSSVDDPFIEMRGKDFWCTLCKIELNSKQQATNHALGNKHRKLIPSGQEDVFSQVPKINLSDVQGSSPIFSSSDDDTSIEMRGKDFWCTLCKVELNSKEQAITHVFGNKHKKLKPSNQEDVNTEIPKSNLPIIKLTNSPKNSLEYSDFKFSFRGICIDNVLDGVKVFGVDDPIVF